MKLNLHVSLITMLLAAPLALLSHAALGADVPAPQAAAPTLPALYVMGDSTAARGDGTRIQGWGQPFLEYFDPSKITVANAAIGGRSSRTYQKEARYKAVIEKLHPGDIVLLQLGHNDVFAVNDATRARGTLHGIGEETEEIDNQLTKQHEVVHTFGWYMRRMIADIQAKGAKPIVLTLTIRDRWNEDGTIERLPTPNLDLGNSNRFSAPPMWSIWSAEVAEAAHLPLLDVHNMIADHDEKVGKEVVSTYYNNPADPTHRNSKGAAVDAEITLACLKALKGPAFDAFLSAQGKAVPAADRKYVLPNLP